MNEITGFPLSDRSDNINNINSYFRVLKYSRVEFKFLKTIYKIKLSDFFVLDTKRVK